MAKKNSKTREKAEYKRLMDLYSDIPENKLDLVTGLIEQAERLKVSLDDLWENIMENGTTEVFQQGHDSFTRERPESKIFTARDKSYQSIIKQLDAMLPPKSKNSKLEEFLDE